MKWMKRALALLLGFLMLTNGGPISVFATDSVSDNDVAVETTAPIEPIEVCEECGGSDAHTETCSFNIVAPLTSTETTEPTATPIGTTESVTTSTVATGSAISADSVGCSECNQAEGHLETCSQYDVTAVTSIEQELGIEESLFEKAMACTSLEAFELVMMEASEEEKAALTETELKELEAHANSLMPEPLPAIEIGENSEEPVISEIVHVTVNYTNVAPLVDAEG